MTGLALTNTGSLSRVLYATPAVSQRLSSLAYQELGRVDSGVWIVAPDQTVRVLADLSAPVFLYFDRYSYEAGTANLSASKVEEVIRKRRDGFATDAKAYVLSWLFDREKVSLEAGLQVWGTASVQVESSLKVLQSLAGLQRYQMAPARAMSVNVLEAESYLLAVLRTALEYPGLKGTKANSSLAAHYEQRRTWTAALQHLVVALGLPQFANSMPFADPARGVFVHPTNEKFQLELARAGEPFVPWRDGLVVVLPQRRIEMLRGQNYTCEILYADGGGFYDSANWLTESQLFRDFETRIRSSPIEVGRGYLDQIDHLHLHQILMKRELCARADANQACKNAGMYDLLRRETDVLRQSLERNRTFSRNQGLNDLDPRSLWPVAEERVTGDISLFATIASRYWPAITPNLEEIDRFRKAY